jgi:hypothetical protein
MATSCRVLRNLSGTALSVLDNGPPRVVGGRSNGDTMNDDFTVQPAPVTAASTIPATPAATPAAAAATPVAGRRAATLARIGLLGIAAAALVAVAMLAVGSSFAPTRTLAGSDSTTGTSGTVESLSGFGGPGFGGRGSHGFMLGGITVTAISGNEIALETEDGWTRTITVDDETEYSKSGDEISLADIAVHDRIAFRQTLEDDGTWTIDAIAVILPHVGGEVTAIDGSTITVERRDGTTSSITVSGDTTYQVNGDDATLADVEVGMVLIAEGTEDDGSFTATEVKAAEPREFFGSPGRHGFGFGFGPGFDQDGDDPNATDALESDNSAS